MSTRSEQGRAIRARRFPLLALPLLFAACIQGPWDYYPNDPPVFRGVYATAYVLSGRPLEQVCFERVLALGEEHTQAFPWYDSADVEVSGAFGGASRTLKLQPNPDSANCFLGDTGARAERGNDYALSARFVWDSAGTRVASLLTATAHVPDSFSVETTAAAPSLAFTGGVPGNIFDSAFILSLPPPILFTLRSEFGDSVLTLRGDSAAFSGYISRKGPAIEARLLELLRSTYEPYREGDTLYYLNGALNTLSHYFSSKRSPNVGAVLITQRFDPNSQRPETRFDSFLGLKPDSSQYYFPGDIRRLIIYPNVKGPKGWNVLDSMGVVNTWFHTRRNRLYFYGFEKAYDDYNATVTGGNDDPRVKPKYNVAGGAGIFAGAIPDSFDVYIRIDTLADAGSPTGAKAYDMPAVHAAYCRKKGWADNEDCREFYPQYCRAGAWKDSVCRADAIRICLDPDSASDASLGSLCDSVAAPARSDTTVLHAGERQSCFERNFPSEAACEAPRAECLESKGQNGCKSQLWDFCLDRGWRGLPGEAPPSGACGPALASYCHDKPRLSETLCRHADAWCAANPDSPLCK